MEGITDFRIGGPVADNNPNRFYDGFIREFRVWNTALDETSINQWMKKYVDETHPYYNNLIGYYKFNEGEGLTAYDASPNGNNGELVGYPMWRKRLPQQMAFNLMATSLRPNVVFDQSEYNTTLDTQIVDYFVPNDVTMLVLFENEGQGLIVAEDDPNHPSLPTNTTYVWPANTYNYVFNANQQIVDSMYVSAQSTLNFNETTYYGSKVTWEIARFITPYGINLDLGPDGTQWVFDVTDYAPILRGEIDIRAGNNQELLDLKFAFVHGTPAREVVGIKNLWGGTFNYWGMINDDNAKPVTLTLPETATSYRIKTRTSGHYFGDSAENCAEFCQKNHYIRVDDALEFVWSVWNECADNPVFPQGGTWVYDRAGWCPGAEVTTFNHELTPLVSPGQTLTIDYDVQSANVQNSGANYVMHTQLIAYAEAARTNDVAIEAIIAPNKDQLQHRKNPICGNPIVRIQNTGETNLTSCMITFGVEEISIYAPAFPCYYVWEGNLAMMESEEIELPLLNWSNLKPENPVFYAIVSHPNGQADAYAPNNEMRVPFELTPSYQTGLTFEFATNGAAYENAYTLKNAQGEVLYERSGMSNYTTYTDGFDLTSGCYILEFTDTGDDGLSWWANNDGNGWARLKNADGSLILTFEPDYGDNIYHEFTVNYTIGEIYEGEICADPSLGAINPSLKDAVKVYPNPTQGSIYIDTDLTKTENMTISVYNSLGARVYYGQYTAVNQNQYQIDLPEQAGVYIVKLETTTQSHTQQVVLVR